MKTQKTAKKGAENERWHDKDLGVRRAGWRGSFFHVGWRVEVRMTADKSSPRGGR